MGITAPEQGLPIQSIEQYKNVFDSLGYTAVGRDELIKSLRLAFLTKNHVLVWGSTGGGKTWLTNEVFGSFPGANTFKLQCTRDMPEEALLGVGYDQKKMRQGKVKYEADEDGSIVKCKFAFIDEAFDAPDFVLRVLLGALNESRTVMLSTNQVFENIPLHTMVATSNFRRDTPTTAAFLNRILMQYQTKAGVSSSDRAMLDVLSQSRRYGNANHKATMDYEELAGLSDIVLGGSEKVPMVLPWSLVYLKDVIIDQFEKEVTKKQLMGGAISSPETARLQEHMLGIDLSHFNVDTLSKRLGYPANLFTDRVVAATLKTLQDAMSSQQDTVQPSTNLNSQDSIISASRGMQANQLLYATALLDNRQQVGKEDLRMLKYGLYPITEETSDYDGCFINALNAALTNTTPTERAQAAVLLSLSSLGDLLFQKAVKVPFPKRLYSQLVPYQSGMLNLDGIEQAANAIQPENARILELKNAISQKLQKAHLLPQSDTAELDLTKDPRILNYDEAV